MRWLEATRGRRFDDYAALWSWSVEQLEEFCRARGISMVALAIGWLLAQEPVTSVIAGATRPAQVVANAAAALWTPSPEDLAELDEISPPPSKIALF